MRGQRISCQYGGSFWRYFNDSDLDQSHKTVILTGHMTVFLDISNI